MSNPLGSLPVGLEPYRRTDTFTKATVPAGLLRDHKTKAGVWGLIQVLQGTLTYRIAATGHEIVLSPGVTGIVEPAILHSVALSDDAEFFVEFWRRPVSAD